MVLQFRFFILTFIFWTCAAEAQTYRRMVSFEWEAIENAKGYEIELRPNFQNKPEEASLGQGKIFNFKVPGAFWKGRLAPGKYLMKLRALDQRGVPGDWSLESDFNVQLENVILKYPAIDEKIQSKEEKNHNLTVEWNPVGSATQYFLSLNSEDGTIQINQTVSDTKFTFDLPVAMNYNWKVSATNAQAIASEKSTTGSFSIIGGPLKYPKIELPESTFVRELKWDRPENVTSFEIKLFQFNTANKKWEKFQAVDDLLNQNIPFDNAWPGGKYKFAVRSKGKLRAKSPYAFLTFNVHPGDRSPLMEQKNTIRKSIDRVSGWYGIASYLITNMQFNGSNPENNSVVIYDAVGGTGRLGLGWFKPTSPAGFLGIVDLSGFTFKDTTQTFASAEANAVFRKNLGDLNQLRLQVGPYYKEVPETIGDPFSGNTKYLKVSSLGSHFGAEYWYPVTAKLGFQVNTHFYISLLKMDTPNGAPIISTISSQFGFLGSYRVTPNFTGLIGYARREDKMAYQTKNYSGNTGSKNNINTSTIIGNYLNLFAEWAF